MSSDFVRIPCPDPECQDGFITVYNIYAQDPLKGEEQPCDICKGRGYITLPANAAIVN
jgi:hypothetical protein